MSAIYGDDSQRHEESFSEYADSAEDDHQDRDESHARDVHQVDVDANADDDLVFFRRGHQTERARREESGAGLRGYDFVQIGGTAKEPGSDSQDPANEAAVPDGGRRSASVEDFTTPAPAPAIPAPVPASTTKHGEHAPAAHPAAVSNGGRPSATASVVDFTTPAPAPFIPAPLPAEADGVAGDSEESEQTVVARLNDERDRLLSADAPRGAPKVQMPTELAAPHSFNLTNVLNFLKSRVTAKKPNAVKGADYSLEELPDFQNGVDPKVAYLMLKLLLRPEQWAKDQIRAFALQLAASVQKKGDKSETEAEEYVTKIANAVTGKLALRAQTEAKSDSALDRRVKRFAQPQPGASPPNTPAAGGPVVPGAAARTPASVTPSATPVAEAAATSAVINVVSFNMWIPWLKPEHLPMQKTLVDTELQGVDFFAFQEYVAPAGTNHLYAKVLDANKYGAVEDSWKGRGDDGLAIAYDKAKWELDADSVQRIAVTPAPQDQWCARKVLVVSFVRKEGGARVRVANFHGPLFKGAKDFKTGTTAIKKAMNTTDFGGPGVLQILLGDFNDLYDHIDKPDGPNMVWDDTTFAHAFNSITSTNITTKFKNFDHIAVAGTALEGGKNADFKDEKVLQGDYSDHPIIKIGIPVKMEEQLGASAGAQTPSASVRDSGESEKAVVARLNEERDSLTRGDPKLQTPPELAAPNSFNLTTVLNFLKSRVTAKKSNAVKGAAYSLEELPDFQNGVDPKVAYLMLKLLLRPEQWAIDQITAFAQQLATSVQKKGDKSETEAKAYIDKIAPAVRGKLALRAQTEAKSDSAFDQHVIRLAHWMEDQLLVSRLNDLRDKFIADLPELQKKIPRELASPENFNLTNVLKYVARRVKETGKDESGKYSASKLPEFKDLPPPVAYLMLRTGLRDEDWAQEKIDEFSEKVFSKRSTPESISAIQNGIKSSLAVRAEPVATGDSALDKLVKKYAMRARTLAADDEKASTPGPVEAAGSTDALRAITSSTEAPGENGDQTDSTTEASEVGAEQEQKSPATTGKEDDTEETDQGEPGENGDQTDSTTEASEVGAEQEQKSNETMVKAGDDTDETDQEQEGKDSDETDKYEREQEKRLEEAADEKPTEEEEEEEAAAEKSTEKSSEKPTSDKKKKKTIITKKEGKKMSGKQLGAIFAAGLLVVCVLVVIAGTRCGGSSSDNTVVGHVPYNASSEEDEETSFDAESKESKADRETKTERKSVKAGESKETESRADETQPRKSQVGSIQSAADRDDGLKVAESSSSGPRKSNSAAAARTSRRSSRDSKALTSGVVAAAAVAGAQGSTSEEDGAAPGHRAESVREHRIHEIRARNASERASASAIRESAKASVRATDETEELETPAPLPHAEESAGSSSRNESDAGPEGESSATD